MGAERCDSSLHCDCTCRQCQVEVNRGQSGQILHICAVIAVVISTIFLNVIYTNHKVDNVERNLRREFIHLYNVNNYDLDSILRLKVDKQKSDEDDRDSVLRYNVLGNNVLNYTNTNITHNYINRLSNILKMAEDEAATVNSRVRRAVSDATPIDVSEPRGSGKENKRHRNEKEGSGRSQRRRKKSKKNRKRSGSKRQREPTSEKPAVQALHLTGPVSEEMWRAANEKGNTQNIDGGMLTGAGLMPTDTLYRFWKQDSSGGLYPNGATFAKYQSNTGSLEIKESGLYYVYAQVMFHDTFQSFAYAINVDGKEALRCLTTRSNVSEEIKMGRMNHVIYEPCATFGVLQLRARQTLTVEDLYKLRSHALLHGLSTLTYWGIIKLN